MSRASDAGPLRTGNVSDTPRARRNPAARASVSSTPYRQNRKVDTRYSATARHAAAAHASVTADTDVSRMWKETDGSATDEAALKAVKIDSERGTRELGRLSY